MANRRDDRPKSYRLILNAPDHGGRTRWLWIDARQPEQAAARTWGPPRRRALCPAGQRWL